MKHRPILDVSHLPSYGYGPASPIWWGTLGFIVLESTGFLLAAGTYLYLAAVNPDWPLATPPPGLLWSTLILAVLLASLWPNRMAKQDAEQEDLGRTRRNLLVMSAVGLVLIGIRFLEFTTLNVRWDQNAYGSILWAILGLHTLHIITDVGDTLVLTALMFTRHGHGKRFSDVSDNAFYWDFVVASWVPLYVLIQGGPRLWPGG
ncbi:cytochrome c oxidase subunit 3 [Prosthecomicrobium sp. N25]|uniref:cytochrome c oxidase subunit 3 n=1 Tax=Prosthecomicrobium sp. N25 TaxID=3129254 RepID=UPI00307717CA